jgi:hypothetical protein
MRRPWLQDANPSRCCAECLPGAIAIACSTLCWGASHAEPNVVPKMSAAQKVARPQPQTKSHNISRYLLLLLQPHHLQQQQQQQRLMMMMMLLQRLAKPH